jgi:hypothetical protein
MVKKQFSLINLGILMLLYKTARSNILGLLLRQNSVESFSELSLTGVIFSEILEIFYLQTAI